MRPIAALKAMRHPNLATQNLIQSRCPILPPKIAIQLSPTKLLHRRTSPFQNPLYPKNHFTQNLASQLSSTPLPTKAPLDRPVGQRPKAESRKPRDQNRRTGVSAAHVPWAAHFSLRISILSAGPRGSRGRRWSGGIRNPRSWRRCRCGQREEDVRRE
jgi:hypothetical protein